MKVTQGEFGHLAVEGPVDSPNCSCVDLQKICIANAMGDCEKLARECNLALSSGGSFCLPNQWGGQTCY
jgi:hypothetical protein